MGMLASSGRSRRDTHPRLQAYIDRVWLPEDRSDRLVSVTFDTAPPDHVVAEEYAVLPWAGNPRYLVPLHTRAASVAGFRTYNAARSPASQLARRAVAAGFDSGVAPRLLRDRLVVSVHDKLPRERWGEVLLVKHLADVLGKPELAAFVAVRRINPAAKPALQLFDRAGAPAGYAKLGTSAPTRALVRTEAAVLAALHGGLPGVVVPELLATGEWDQTVFAVGSPVPTDVRRWTKGPEATVPALRQINALSSHRSRLGDSPYAHRLRAEFAAEAAAVDVAPLLAAWLDELAQSQEQIEFGRMHGDWMAGNLGRLPGGLAVWDWEYSAADAPVGFDLLHWPFHYALSGQNLASAVNAVERAASGLELLGVPASARSLVVSTYLLDIFARWAKLVAGGISWNPKWYPDLVRVVTTRRAAQLSPASRSV